MPKIGRLRNIFIFLAVIAVGLVSAGILTAGTSDQNLMRSYDAAFRGEFEFPPFDALGGRSFVKNEVGGENDLSNIKLVAKLPVDPESETFWQDISFELVGRNKSLPVTVNPAESTGIKNSTKLSDGRTLRWGDIAGTITVLGKPRICTIGIYEIPSEEKALFTFCLEAGGQNPPASLTFGNLDWSKEMWQVTMNGQEN